LNNNTLPPNQHLFQLDLSPVLTAPYLDWFSGVDLNAPHKPVRGLQFAYVTEVHEEASHIAKLNPCAELLYRYFLRLIQAGIKIEVSVKEIQEWTHKVGCGYTIQHIRRSLKQLANAQLINVVKRYLGSGFFQVIVRHAGAVFNTAKDKPTLTEKGTKKFFQEPKCSQHDSQTRIPWLPATENLPKKAEQNAAASKNISAEARKGKPTGNEFLPTPKLEARLEENGDESEEPVINVEATEILEVLRDAMPLNPTIKAEVLKYTLTEVQVAIALYQERKTKKTIYNPHGFLTDALRGKWAMSASLNKAAAVDLFPAELVKWYEWAIATGIVDGRPLRHCPDASTHGSNERLQVVLPIPPEERCPNDIVPFRYVYWGDALALYPMPEATVQSVKPPELEDDPLEFEAAELPEAFEPDLEIQQLIKMSLDDSSG